MADWTTLPNTAVGVGGLPSGTTITALRDNSVAIAEGAAGAPRLYLRAIEHLTAGDSIRSRNDATVSPGANITSVLHLFGFMQYGTVRARAEKVAAAGTLTLARARNAVETTLLSINSTGIHTVDASVLPGDTLIWRIAGSTVSGSSARNARISTGGEDYWCAPTNMRLEGNRDAL